MPTYEYACTNCGVRTEVVQSFADDPLTTCERCGGKLRRVFQPVGVLFKGSGFYSTDSRSSKTSKTDGGGKKKSEPPKDGSAKTEASTTSSTSSKESSSGNSSE